jgi:hypothetical protein
MNHIELAIRDAIDGGWKDSTSCPEDLSHQALVSAWRHGLAALVPALWQALGKARGWGKPKTYEYDRFQNGRRITDHPHIARTRHMEKTMAPLHAPPQKKDAEQFFEILK